MAEEEASLLIRLKDEASKGLQNIKGSVLALSAAVAGLTAFLISSAKSFIESDRVVVKLNASLKAQGIFTEQLSKEMQAYARELQKQTTFSDEAILSSQNLLTTFGIAGQKMKEATAAATNLAAGLGIDLNTAAMLVGKAFTGQTETLGRYGVKVDESIPASEKFAAVLEAINQRFGGAAQAEAESYAGRIENLKNRFDDVKESIGEALMPVLDSALKTIEFFIGGLEQLGGVFPAVFATGLAVLQEFVAGLQYAVESIPFLSEALGVVGVNFETINQNLQTHIDNLIAMGIQDQLSSEQQILNSNMITQTSIDNANRMAEEEKKAKDKILTEEKKKQAEIKKARDAGYLAYRKDQEELAKFDKLQNEQKMQNFQSTLQFISSLSKSENKTLAAIGKAAAIGTATVDTYVAANKALASAPPPFNFALAAAVVTAGLANVARISGIKMAQGGVVLPRAGGTQAIIGEAGKAEAVIPLGSDSAKEKLQEAGLGATTINISVGNLVGSDGMREFAKMIDSEIFSLRRNNESVAFEAF